MTHTVELPVAVPAELISDFLNKLHYVAEDLQSFHLPEGVTHQVRFDVRPGAESSAPLIADRISQVAEKMCAGHRGYQPTVLVSRRRPDLPYRQDPRPVLEAQGQLREYGRGRFGLGPLLVALLEYFDAGLLRLADGLSAVRHQFPALIGAEVLDQCRYLQSFPHALTIASHLREDLEAIQSFARGARIQDGRLACAAEHLAGSECLLAPTICFHYYAWLRGSDLTGPQAITASGRCFRYESGAMSSLERLWDFTMREIIFAGSSRYVLGQRQACLDAAVALLDEWGLSYEVRSATDPFFIDGFSTQAAFQAAFELKFEVRADLPYVPGRTLAVGSFNYHQDFFGRSLGINQPDGPACTSCVGFGMERLAWAFLSQYGPDPAAWPLAVRSGLRKGLPGWTAALTNSTVQPRPRGLHQRGVRLGVRTWQRTRQ
jgi:hypothetical protein